MGIYVDGELVGSATASALIPKAPSRGLSFGGSSSGDAYAGLLDEVVIYHRALSAEEIQARASAAANARSASNARVVCSFNGNDARDESGNGISGVMAGVEVARGKNGAALFFKPTVPPVGGTSGSGVATAAGTDDRKAGSAPSSGKPAPSGNAGTFVQYDWTSHVPVVTRAMSMAGKEVVVSGTPSVMNEEEAFAKIMEKDPAIQQTLKEADAAIRGQRGAAVKLVGKESGQVGRELPLKSAPVWDGMAVARGHLYIVTEDGKIQCYGQPVKP